MKVTCNEIRIGIESLQSVMLLSKLDVSSFWIVMMMGISSDDHLAIIVKYANKNDILFAEKIL